MTTADIHRRPKPKNRVRPCWVRVQTTPEERATFERTVKLYGGNQRETFMAAVERLEAELAEKVVLFRCTCERELGLSPAEFRLLSPAVPRCWACCSPMEMVP